MKTFTILILALFSAAALADIAIPLDKNAFILPIKKEWRWKKKCEESSNQKCFELWDKTSFTSIFITKLSKNSKELKCINGHSQNTIKDLIYCSKKEKNSLSVMLTIDGHIIVMNEKFKKTSKHIKYILEQQ